MKNPSVASATAWLLGLAALAAAALPAAADTCDVDHAEPAYEDARDASPESATEPGRDAMTPPSQDVRPPTAEARSDQTQP